MAIQFECVVCHQPIEVDGEWAGKTVACPFCHSRVNAPVESQPFDPVVPTASPVSPQVSQVPADLVLGHPAPVMVQPRRNRLAIIAAALAGIMLISLITMRSIQGAHIAELEKLNARMLELAKDGKGMMQSSQTAMMEFLDANKGTVPSWMVVWYALMFVSGMLWVATLVCALLGVRVPFHRRYAVGALVVCGFTPILCCCGGAI